MENVEYRTERRTVNGEQRIRIQNPESRIRLKNRNKSTVNSMNSLNSHKGFTLVEILVVIAIFAIVMVGLLIMLTSFLRVRNSDDTDRSLKSEGNYALDRIEYMIRNGMSMPNICCSGTACPGGGGEEIKIVMPNTGEDYPFRINTISLENNRIKVRETSGINDPVVEYYLTSGDGDILANDLIFNCAVQTSGGDKKSAIVTLSFSLNMQKDNLRDFVSTTQRFERSVAVQNNYRYIVPD